MNTSGVDLKCGHEGFPESSVCFCQFCPYMYDGFIFYQKPCGDIWNCFKELITHKSKSKFCNICVTFGAGAKTSGRGEWLNVDEQKSGWFEKNAAAVKNPDCEKWREFPWAPPSSSLLYTVWYDIEWCAWYSTMGVVRYDTATVARGMGRYAHHCGTALGWETLISLSWTLSTSQKYHHFKHHHQQHWVWIKFILQIKIEPGFQHSPRHLHNRL